MPLKVFEGWDSSFLLRRPVLWPRPWKDLWSRKVGSWAYWIGLYFWKQVDWSNCWNWLQQFGLLDLVDEAFALATVVLASANVAELVLASTSHVVTAFVLLNPELAVRTLLVLGALHQKHELLVVFAEIGHLLVLLAAEASVEVALAGQTVMLFAGWTLVVCEGLVKGEDCAAAGSGAPTCVLHVLLHVVVKGELIVLLSQLVLQELGYFLLQKLDPAVLVRTGDGYHFVGDLFSAVAVEALSVIHVATAQAAKMQGVDVSGTNGALNSQILRHYLLILQVSPKVLVVEISVVQCKFVHKMLDAGTQFFEEVFGGFAEKFEFEQGQNLQHILGRYEAILEHHEQLGGYRFDLLGVLQREGEGKVAEGEGEVDGMRSDLLEFKQLVLQVVLVFHCKI